MVVKIRDMQGLEVGQRPRLPGGGFILLSESVELNIKSVEQSLYHWKYD